MALADVEIDMFSGLPNPGWSLSEAQTTMFLNMLSALPRTNEHPMGEKLGYRRMVVRVHDATESKMHLFDSLVEVGGLFYADSGQHLARWLLRSGRSSLDEDIYEIMKGYL